MIALEPRVDERGLFARAFCAQEFAAAGLATEFVQANISTNARAGTVRGLHFQRAPHAEVKLVRCVKGALYDVIVDMREGSQTYLRWFGAELSDDNGLMMYVPKGFAHGYQALTDGATAFYMVSAFYAPQAEGGLALRRSQTGDRVAARGFRYFRQGCPMAAAAPLILLTGATGFVGRQVLRALGERNCRVRAVVRNGTQDRLAASHAIEKTVTSPDIFAENAAWWTRACRDVDTVDPRRLVRRARAISAIAEKSGLPGGNSAACARRDRTPRSGALSASAPVSNMI